LIAFSLSSLSLSLSQPLHHPCPLTISPPPGLPDFSRYNISKRGEIYQITIKTPNGHKICKPIGLKIDQIDLKRTNIFHWMTHQNLPKLGFLVWKYTIWQPCPSLSLSSLRRQQKCYFFRIDKMVTFRWRTTVEIRVRR
jgi:hypothetical protein